MRALLSEPGRRPRRSALWEAPEAAVKRDCAVRKAHAWVDPGVGDAQRVRASTGAPQSDGVHRAAGTSKRWAKEGRCPVSHCRDHTAQLMGHEEEGQAGSRRSHLQGWQPFGTGVPQDCGQRLLSVGSATLGRRRRRRENLQTVGTVALLVGLMCALLPRASCQQFFRPVYLFEGQVLTLCLDSPEEIAKSVECKQNYIEPAVPSTRGLGMLKACTHDSSVYYECKDPGDGGCACFGSCLPNVGFPAECMEVVYSIEDTWSYLGVYIWHNPGLEISKLPFIGFPSHHLHYKLTVTYGELDLLGSFLACGPWDPDPEKKKVSLWQSPADLPSEVFAQDPEGRELEYWCDVPLASLPGKWRDVQHAPYFIRYKRYYEKNFLIKRTLEFAGTYELLDPILRLVKYKARPNENSNRIKSAIYNKQSHEKQPNEFLVLEVATRIDATRRPPIDRFVLHSLCWCFFHVCMFVFVS